MGVIITNDLKWTENTKEICSKVNRKLYIISKLKQYGLKVKELITIWVSVLRPISEYVAPLWHSGLTEKDTSKLKMLQIKVLTIILGTEYIDNRKYYKVENKTYTYEKTLQLIGLTSLKCRREALTSKFAVNAVLSQNHSSMFAKNDTDCMITRNRLNYKEPKCKTNRYYNSAIPYMTRLLNNMCQNAK